MLCAHKVLSILKNLLKPTLIYRDFNILLTLGKLSSNGVFLLSFSIPKTPNSNFNHKYLVNNFAFAKYLLPRYLTKLKEQTYNPNNLDTPQGHVLSHRQQIIWLFFEILYNL